ncbi:hypothetical protein BT63DRAFT_458688 [Microthyrium microscopicum]|uniref:Rab proteins geranylgeranyltransferase n=1 Tax=Microthyrium microscopicum TaxID=703497 RepID=A0A6A6U2I5_9PEZI|nr:hypothetical protein BT63DRAFT_458688 [Microthyrium microscopicum]
MQAESLNDTDWDIVIAGTGLYQSLLALALSRSDKKVLHLDKNSYYGEAEAAFSLQEAEEWVKEQNNSSASIENLSPSEEDGPKLSFPRAYSLALAPQLIYTSSKLIECLVTSKAFRQLEFQAMGSWWLYSASKDSEPDSSGTPAEASGNLVRIPTNREDVAFSDSTIDLRSKRSVMKVLRFIMDYDNQEELWEGYKERPFAEFLTNHFKLPPTLVDLFLALTFSPTCSSQTTTAFALPRISRHLRSIGRLGPGFSSVIPKWGGLAEVSQVGCRAGAVGGAVYMLGSGISKTESIDDSTTLHLTSGDIVRTKHLVANPVSLSSNSSQPSQNSSEGTSRSISIVGSSLPALFPQLTEGAPIPAGAVVIRPAGSFPSETSDPAPVQLIIHSSETGECPKNQCIIYASTPASAPAGPSLLDAAVNALLACIDNPPVLWRMHYPFVPARIPSDAGDGVHLFPAGMSADLVFDDTILDRVETIWRALVGDTNAAFLVFEDREGQAEDEEDEYL